jgi:hypothetical protein
MPPHLNSSSGEALMEASSGLIKSRKQINKRTFFRLQASRNLKADEAFTDV